MSKIVTALISAALLCGLAGLMDSRVIESAVVVGLACVFVALISHIWREDIRILLAGRSRSPTSISSALRDFALGLIALFLGLAMLRGRSDFFPWGFLVLLSIALLIVAARKHLRGSARATVAPPPVASTYAPSAPSPVPPPAASRHSPTDLGKTRPMPPRGSP